MEQQKAKRYMNSLEILSNINTNSGKITIKIFVQYENYKLMDFLVDDIIFFLYIGIIITLILPCNDNLHTYTNFIKKQDKNL